MELGKHGYNGGCAPDGPWSGHFGTFSYGIFEWVAKASGKGTKKGTVKVRVSGPSSELQAVKAETERIIALLDEGQYVGPKNVKVK